MHCKVGIQENKPFRQSSISPERVAITAICGYVTRTTPHFPHKLFVFFCLSLLLTNDVDRVGIYPMLK
jgi:hypothetical protein